jgi:flagellar biosynthesis chaperone FliJ
MAQRFALGRVLELAERRAEDKAREVKQAHGDWLRARGQQVRLRASRDAGVDGLARLLGAGLSAAELARRTARRRSDEHALAQAAARVAGAYDAWQQRLREWQVLDARVRALRALAARHRHAQDVEARRLEQRQHDELTQHARIWRRDSGRG